LGGHLGDLNTALAIGGSAPRKRVWMSRQPPLPSGLWKGSAKSKIVSSVYERGNDREPDQTQWSAFNIGGCQDGRRGAEDCSAGDHRLHRLRSPQRQGQQYPARNESSRVSYVVIRTVQHSALVFYDAAMLQGIIEALVYTNECKAKDCRAAVTGNGEQRNLTITALDMQKRGGV